MITVCCSAPEGQFGSFGWDLDQFNQSIMMLKDVSSSVRRCLSKRRRSALYGRTTLFSVHPQTFRPLRYDGDILHLRLGSFCTPLGAGASLPQVFFLHRLFSKTNLLLLGVVLLCSVFKFVMGLNLSALSHVWLEAETPVKTELSRVIC